MRKPKKVYPDYTLSEQIADGSMHALGVVGALAGFIVLMIWTVGQVSAGQSAALAVYGLALFATFCASAFYHMTPWKSLRPTLRRFDHAAIYLKIAGTYTPLVVLIGSLSSYLILFVVWLLAVFGIVKKLFFWNTAAKSGTMLYLLMGWMSVTLIWSLVPILSWTALALIASGGILYTVGVIFFSWESLKFSNAIWHGFVVAASACFYAAIALGVHGSLA